MAEAKANSLQQCPKHREYAQIQMLVVFHLKILGKFQGSLWQAQQPGQVWEGAAGTMAPTTGM